MGHNCCSKQKVKRGLWSPEEDDKLIKYITTHGHGSWSSVPKLAGLQRCGKSCRLRWINYLRPDLKRGSFTEQEERIIIDIHRILGNRWAQIAKHLPGRTDNEVKNFWNSCIKKKLISQGIDPNTHNLLSPTQIFNNNYNNACNLAAAQDNSPVFLLDSQMKDSSMEIMKSAFLQLPYVIPSQENNITHSLSSSMCEISSIPTTEYQNPNLFWSTIQEKNLHSSMESTNQSSITSVPISSSPTNPSGFGLIDENNGMLLSGSFDHELIETPGKGAMQVKQPLNSQQEKAYEGANYEKITNHDQLNDGQINMNASFEKTNFDFDFLESTVFPCGMYCNLSPMDQFAWD